MIFGNKLKEMSIGMVSQRLEEMKDGDTAEYDKTLEMLLLMTEVATHFLKENKEFREKFAEIHAEFIKSPESERVIEESIIAYDNFKEKQETMV
jgi:hypothetical protein